MLKGVEADPAELPGRVVAKAVGDKAVGGLMKGDGDEERQHPDRKVIDEMFKRWPRFRRY